MKKPPMRWSSARRNYVLKAKEEGKSHSEIAKELKISKPAVSVMLTRARKRAQFMTIYLDDYKLIDALKLAAKKRRSTPHAMAKRLISSGVEEIVGSK
jgi:hypothetical protein